MIAGFVILIAIFAVYALTRQTAPSNLTPTPVPTTTSEPNERAKDNCVISGCNGEACADEAVMSPCVSLPEHTCYRNTICERQADGNCDWTPTDDLLTCLDNPPTDILQP